MNKELQNLLRLEREVYVSKIQAIDSLLNESATMPINGESSPIRLSTQQNNLIGPKTKDVTWPLYIYKWVESLGSPVKSGTVAKKVVDANPESEAKVMKRQVSNHLMKLSKEGILKGEPVSRSKKDGTIYTIIDKDKALQL